MRSLFARTAILLGGVALMLICSCDKHKLGELPELQREHVELAQGRSAAQPSPEASAKMGSTPAQFFSPSQKP